MITEVSQRVTPEGPQENFSRGLLGVEIPELGEPIKGKVRDCWVVGKGADAKRILVTTDRQSAYDRILGLIPQKGQALNLTSAFWFDLTKHIIPNHMIAIPHPNVLVAKEAVATLPVEVVVRRYMAKSSTSTSVYDHYRKGERTIYGIEFPDGLEANQKLPMGPIITPTTKAAKGHDEELTDDQARQRVDGQLGDGIWAQVKIVAPQIFQFVSEKCKERGLIIADTKLEFGLDREGNLMLIDEAFTPDSSRFWLTETYDEKFRNSQTPDTFDKEILRRWLSERGFRGDGQIPKIDRAVIDEMTTAYAVPYNMLSGEELPNIPSDPEEIRAAILRYVDRRRETT